MKYIAALFYLVVCLTVSSQDPIHCLLVSVKAETTDFLDKIINIPIDLQSNIAASGIRITEVNETGKTIDDQVFFQLDRIEADKEQAIVVLQVKGKLCRGEIRHYRIMAGPGEQKIQDNCQKNRITYTDSVYHQGQYSFRIKTTNEIYLFHKDGAGFASIIDQDGNDWISYRPGGGSAGEYRGIPNIRPAGFHPGYDYLNSKILSTGPLKLTIQSETNDKKWSIRWDIYPEYATMTLLKKDTGTYWLLYEGTPAGNLDVNSNYWVRSDGNRLPVSEDWTGILPDPEWVYFGDKQYNRVFFLAKHEHDNKIDQFWQMQENMTVFGFGRKPHETPGTYMHKVPVNMTIGFIESAEHEKIMSTIKSAVNEPQIYLTPCPL